MIPSTVYLPNGQSLTVTPVFGGLFFKSNDLDLHQSAIPPGWTIIIHAEGEENQSNDSKELKHGEGDRQHEKGLLRRWAAPTLHSDNMYISSISNPSDQDFKPAISPTRAVALMLWATLYWYFHQTPPDFRLTTNASAKTSEAGKPRGDWKIGIKPDGILKKKHVLAKLERMGLVSCEDSSVGLEEDWHDVFVSRRAFWQLDPRIYLFTLSPTASSQYPFSSPYTSRPSSPSRDVFPPRAASQADAPHVLAGSLVPAPYRSASHLPTYYPPPPPQYIFTGNIRHPLRPKPPQQGEVFYTRFIPSFGQYLSFRVASLSPKQVVDGGPSSSLTTTGARFSHHSISDSTLARLSGHAAPGPSDLDLLHRWMNEKRVADTWNTDGPREVQEEFLKRSLSSKHSMPAIGSWDGKPFGFFEIYWVKEDILGRYIGGEAGNWDRGLRCLVGEQEFRGPDRVRAWLSALVHFCWIVDNRTEIVMLEPRVDNDR